MIISISFFVSSRLVSQYFQYILPMPLHGCTYEYSYTAGYMFKVHVSHDPLVVQTNVATFVEQFDIIIAIGIRFLTLLYKYTLHDLP